MRIDLSYNDVNLEVYVGNQKLDQHKIALIRHKTFEFFDALQDIFKTSEVLTEIIHHPTCTIVPTSIALAEKEVKPFIVEQTQKEIESNEQVKLDSQTINILTGDKRVEKKRFEDMSIEELGVDARGLPWNPEIHAATKTKRKDGSWKLKKGSNLLQAAEKEKQILQDLPPPPPSEETIEIKQRVIPQTFTQMVDLIDEIIDSGRIDIAGVMKILADLGFNSILHLRDNVAVYDKVYKQFHAAVGGVL